MAFQELLTRVRALAQTVHALAAVGAELQLKDNETEGDARVRALLQQAVRTIDPELLNGLTREQRAMILGTIRMTFLDANDLLTRPTRAPGWDHTDPAILEAQSWTPRRIVGRIAAVAAPRPDLATATAPGPRLPSTLMVGHGSYHGISCRSQP